MILNSKKKLKKMLISSMFAWPLLIYGQTPTNSKYDFTVLLTGVDGKPLQMNSADGPKKLTLGDVAVESLEGQTANDRNETGLDKFKRDELARKIYNQKGITLSVEEIKLIKDRIGQSYAPGVVGAAWRLLDSSIK